jgi:predicted enzyme related to lactoylglutathione lyase
MNTKLNHVAMSVPADEFDQAARDNLMAFYGEVFGWSEYRSNEAGNPLVIRVGDGGQFVFVCPEAGEAMRAHRMDHFGVQVDTEEDLDGILDRARRYAEKDPRVEVSDKEVTRYVPSADASQQMRGIDVDVINCYIRFLLPMMVEVQHFRVTRSS